MATVKRAFLMIVLLSIASRAYCSLEEACCARSYAKLLAEPSCVATVAAGGAGAVFGIPLALKVIGFGVLGPVGGSIAALMQSAGLAGSMFSVLQSAGMVGVGTKTAMGGASAAFTLCCAGVECTVR